MSSKSFKHPAMAIVDARQCIYLIDSEKDGVILSEIKARQALASCSNIRASTRELKYDNVRRSQLRSRFGRNRMGDL